MRNAHRVFRWVTLLLFGWATSVFAAGYYFEVGIGDECDPGAAWMSPLVHYQVVGACFDPAVLTIDVGDTVVFYQYAGMWYTGPHNVVADDGSFRCARGCDGEGGNGTPVTDGICTSVGCWSNDPAQRLGFMRKFNTPGIVKYHDEVTGAPGVIYVGVSPPPAPALNTIDSSYTGTWFNSAQSGMGFMVEVLPGSPMRMLASWLTFSPEGQSSWIVGLGPVDGNRAMLDATQTVGGGARFPPSFDPTRIATQNWGALTFTFTDCKNGRVDWSSALPGYGSGSMDLTRLTVPLGLTCIAGTAIAADAEGASP
jgi:plastocyanin